MKNSSVTGIIFNEDATQVLAIKRRDVPIWVLPGGRIDPGESPEDAVVREALEETGLQVSIKRLVGTYTPVNRLTTMTHLFICEVESGSLTIGEETRDIQFFPLRSLPKGFFHIHEGMIHDALESSTGVFHKLLTQVTYWNLLKYFLKHPIRVTRFILSQLGFPINT